MRFGPQTPEIERVFAALRELRWLAHAGEPLADRRVALAASWDDALEIFDEPSVYNDNGLLLAACERADRALTALPARNDWWHRARDEAKPHEARGSLTALVPLAERKRVTEHVYEFVSMLLVEIIAAPEVGSTYFRDQFAWFRAGHFPCGWNGAWPDGRMRVF